MVADRGDTWLEATTRTTRQSVASLFLPRCPSQAIFSSHCDHLSNRSRSVIGSKAHSIGTVFMEGVISHFAPVATANAPSETTTTTATTTTQGIERFGTACVQRWLLPTNLYSCRFVGCLLWHRPDTSYRDCRRHLQSVSLGLRQNRAVMPEIQRPKDGWASKRGSVTALRADSPWDDILNRKRPPTTSQNVEIVTHGVRV